MGRKPQLKTPESAAWYFYNNCLLNRHRIYHRHKFKTQPKPNTCFTCTECGKQVYAYKILRDEIVCHTCYEIHQGNLLSEERKEIMQNAEESANKFIELLDDCEKLGTCDILASHHELLKEDDDRIKTDFLLDLICKDNYGSKWEEIMKNNQNIITTAKNHYRQPDNPQDAI